MKEATKLLQVEKIKIDTGKKEPDSITSSSSAKRLLSIIIIKSVDHSRAFVLYYYLKLHATHSNSNEDILINTGTVGYIRSS
jgi:hypothetical protein